MSFFRKGDGFYIIKRNWTSKLYIVFCGAFVYMMAAHTTVKSLLIYGIVGGGLSYGLYKSRGLFESSEKKPCVDLSMVLSLSLSLAICIFLLPEFAEKWSASSLISHLASICGFSSHTFLIIGGIISLLVIFPGLSTLIGYIIHWAINSISTDPANTVLFTLATLAMSVQLQYSCVLSFQMVFQVKKLFIVSNTFAIWLFIRFVCLKFKNSGIALAIISISTTLWSIVNYYVILFHGSPLFFSEFPNTFTALNVASKYQFKIDSIVSILLLLFLFQLVCAIIIIWKGKKQKKDLEGKKRYLFAVLISFSLTVLLIYTNDELKPKSTMTGSWTYGVNDYGYVCCLFEDIDRRIDPIVKPEGYSPELIRREKNENQNIITDEYPDIIMILNESFYDLRVYLDIETDIDYLSDFYGIEKTYYGYVIQPGYCGGTNNTEFELLTSNSMALLPISAPFTYLDFSSNKNSIADNLKSKGYSTVAMHCGGKSNYSRNRVYPLIGFDNCLLGSDPFTYSQYGNRPWTDADNYIDLIKYYEQMGENPRFIYLLTIQNHGGWEQNDSSYDIVHCLSDLGEKTEIVNEYLSSIKKSGEAFAKLIAYFKASDRPVLIFMMGDHAPSFLAEMVPSGNMSETEIRLASHSVPYAVWANFDIDWTKKSYYLTTTDVVPQIKKWVDLPLSTYDCSILQMHGAAPCRLPSGEYWDPLFQTGFYQPFSDEYPSALIRKYLFMEYSLLKGGKDYFSEWFQ